MEMGFEAPPRVLLSNGQLEPADNTPNHLRVRLLRVTGIVLVESIPVRSTERSLRLRDNPFRQLFLLCVEIEIELICVDYVD